MAQPRLTASAPSPASDRANGDGGAGSTNFPQAVHSVARPGTSRISASAMPTRERRAADHAIAKKISRLTEVSSRKSMLSANSDTEPIASATANSTPK